jgi:hypothetical protein
MANQINIAVGANIDDLQSGLKAAVTTVTQAGDSMSKAGQAATQKTEVAFKNLQQAYRATAKDAQVLAMTLGTDSAAFQEAAQRAAMFRDQLDDVQDAINAYHPEKKWKVTSDVIGGAANVAQGFVGALQLIGVESMNAEKAIATMLALNGIAQAVQSVEALKGAFIALSGTMQVALGAIALLGAAYLVYNSYAAETEEANKRLADSFKQIEEAEKRNTSIVQETNDLRIKAMKEGADKRKAIAENEYDKSLRALVDSYQKGEIADITYQSRKKYLWQIYQNELTKIQEDAQKNREKLANPIKLKQVNEISTRVSGGSDLNMMAAGALGSKVQQSLDSGWKMINASNLKGMDAFKASWNGFKKNVQDTKVELELTMQQMAQGISSAIDSAVSAAMTGGDVGKALVSSLLGSMGNFMKQWGAQLILVGLGAEALKASLATLNGVAAIAAGAALVAAGAVATSMASNMARGGGSMGGGYGGAMSGGYSGFNPIGSGMNNFSFDGVVRGSNLEIVLLNTNQQNRRIR